MAGFIRDGDSGTAAYYEHEVAPHVRRLRSRALRDRLAESLLFLPIMMLAGAMLLALLLAEIDERYMVDPSEVITFTPDVAVTLLGIIAGATITTAGVVFSLLVVSLQLASGQFSPRVLRGFWRDRHGQVLVGLLLSTFAFCVLALARIDTAAEHAPRSPSAARCCSPCSRSSRSSSTWTGSAATSTSAGSCSASPGRPRA
ncbi:DUF2254 family protein [Catellatospora coxensis]